MLCDASKGSKLLEDWLESDSCKKKEILVDSVADVVKMVLRIHRNVIVNILIDNEVLSDKIRAEIQFDSNLETRQIRL